MREYIKKSALTGLLAVWAVLIFCEGSHTKANTVDSMKQKEEWIWPANGVISDTYGTRLGRHKGIDIAGDLNSPILAVEDGIVEKSYYSDSYGNVVFIHHPSNYVTVYAHLNSRLVEEGQSVSKGQMIGEMGRSGQSTGVHLHFEAHQSEWRYDKKFALDPEGLLGAKKLGEVVQAGAVNHEVSALEASTRYHLQEENKINQHTINYNGINETYLVKEGDTLSSISLKLNLSIKELKRKNGLLSDLIQPGQKLIVR
jgi:murein DD-endopeptidase MepM/ murein hydrolase activator NlpD